MTATCLKVFMDCYFKQEITKCRIEETKSIVNKAYFAYKVLISAVHSCLFVCLFVCFFYLPSAALFSLKLWNIFHYRKLPKVTPLVGSRKVVT